MGEKLCWLWKEQLGFLPLHKDGLESWRRGGKKCSLRWGNWRQEFSAKRKGNSLRILIERRSKIPYAFLSERSNAYEGESAHMMRKRSLLPYQRPLGDADLILDNRSRYRYAFHHGWACVLVSLPTVIYYLGLNLSHPIVCTFFSASPNACYGSLQRDPRYA